MNHFENNWKLLKELWWEPFLDRQVYLDDLDNVFVIKENDGSFVIVGYLHTTGYLFGVGALISFINDINKIAIERWPKGNLKMVINRPISNIKSSSLMKMLPSDVEYYFFDKVIHKNMIPTIQDLRREIGFWKNMERTPRGSYNDGPYCSACQESPCMCSDPERSSTYW